MNGLDEIRVARESLQGGRLIPPEESSDGVLLRLQIGKVEPRQIILAVAPDSLKGVALGALRGQEYEVHVVRQGEPLGRMCPTMVQEEDIQAVSKGLGEGLDEELAPVRIARRQFQNAALARGGFHGAIDRDPCEDVLDRANGLHPTSREAPPADGQEAEAAFVLTEPPDRAGVRGGHRRLELGLTAGLERGDGLRLFLCAWGAAL